MEAETETYILIHRSTANNSTNEINRKYVLDNRLYSTTVTHHVYLYIYISISIVRSNENDAKMPSKRVS